MDGLDNIRKMLKRVDQLVEVEFLKLEDQIDMLKEKIAKNSDRENEFDLLQKESLKLAKDYRELRRKYEDVVDEKEKLLEFKEKYIKLQNDFDVLTKIFNGFKFTVDVISDWLPSQRENIAVLIALSSSPDHFLSIDDLHKETTIPVVTLKNRVIPILEEKLLVKREGETIMLTFEKHA